MGIAVHVKNGHHNFTEKLSFVRRL